MKENKYDDKAFFEKYSRLERSAGGLEDAGEWRELKKMFPDFKGKRVLDLGCGFGWHCAYAARNGAVSVVGVDISDKMLAVAKKKTNSPNVKYIRTAIEDYEYPKNSFDVVISSLAFHYIESFDDVCIRVNRCLAPDGDFIFSAEHPVFTAQGPEQWYRDESGNILHWPVDRYFFEGARTARFLGEDVVKYHRTLTTYISCLLRHGFVITGVSEPEPPEEMLAEPGMTDELRRPMMLIISSKKKSASVRFRPATGSDVRAMKDIAKRVINANYAAFLGADSAAAFIDSGSPDREIDDGLASCTLMIHDERIIGFAVTDYDLLHLMMVDVPFQGSGYGSALLEHVEGTLFESFKRIRLQTFKNNTPAVNLYLKKGWMTYHEDFTESGLVMLSLQKTIKR